MPRTPFRLALVAGAASVSLLLTGCDGIMGGQDNPFEAPAAGVTSVPSPTPICNNGPYESVFSAYGSIHYTRELAENLTLILDMYTDEKTHDWYADTPKELSFVVKVLDTNAEEGDPFKKKRKTYMERIVIEANSVTKEGQTESFFREDLDPIEATLDPEALKSRYGLLITSPKGGFQREHNALAPATLPGTVGFDMNFRLTISSQVALGKKKYDTRDYEITLPVTIFDKKTKDTSSSCAANSTLAPVDVNGDSAASVAEEAEATE